MRRRMTALLGLAGFLGLQASAWGQTTFSWINSGGGSYHTAGNWSPAGGPPGDDDIAQFNLAGSHTISFANTGTDSGSFRIRQGTVIFQGANATASHAWGQNQAGSQVNSISPLAGDTATEARLILRNMTQSMLGESLSVGTVSGKTGRLEISNATWVGSGLTVIGMDDGLGTTLLTSGGRLFGNDMFVGLNSSQANTLTVQDANSLVNVAALRVGAGGNGAVSVLNGGRINASDMKVGEYGAGSLLVSGTNSQVNVTGDFYLGEESQPSQATIQNGGQLTVGDTLAVGLNSNTTLSVLSGGRIDTQILYVGGAGLSATVNVQGTNSRLQFTSPNSFTYVGFTGGTGTLNVTDNAIFGNLTTALVVGLGSSSLDTTGFLTASSGATIQARSLIVGEVRGNGQVNLTGSTTSMQVAEAIHLGASPGPSGQLRGTIDINDQAQLSAASLILGSSPQDNRITIRNGGRLILSGMAEIGQQRGTLVIESGGRLTSNGGSIASLNSTSLGAVTVTGTGSSWNAGGTNALDVGRAGIGSLTINQGAVVQGGNGTIGGYEGGLGNVTLTGNNSAFTLTGTLSIGGITAQGGSGTLNINPGTSASAGGTLSLWSSGTLNLNGGTLEMGAFNHHAGQFNWTAGTVNFSQGTTLTNNLLNSLVGTGHVMGQNRTLGSPTGTPLTVGANLTVDGGRLSSGGTLAVNAGNTLVVNNGGEVSSSGVVTNNGNITMNGLTSSMSGNTIDNRGSIRGTGVINNTLSNNTTGQVRVAASDWLTFNGSGHGNQGSVQLLGGVLEFSSFLNTGTQGFISGHGTLIGSSASQGGLGHVNTGTYAFSGGNTNLYGDVQNNTTGRIITSGGSVTTFHDDVLHNGVEIRTSFGASTVFLGSVSGAGPFTGAGLVQFEGDLRPGNSPANVQFAGDVEFSVTARLISELGGVLPGDEYDRLTVQGQILLSGQLDVQLINGFIPNAGDTFMIIDNQGTGSVFGTFAGLAEGSSFVSNGQLWNITYQGGTGNDVMLLAVPEPTTWALIGMTMLGGAGVGWYRRRRVKATTDTI